MKGSSSKTKSFDLINYPFDSKLKGEWMGFTDTSFKFLEVYIQKKYKETLHYLPFIELGIIENCISSNKNEYKFGVLDYSTLKGYENSTTDSNEVIELDKIKKKFKDTKKRFTFYQVHQEYIDCDGNRDGHSMLFLYDKQDNTVELFNSVPDDFSPYAKKISSFFKDIYGDNIKIIYPSKLMAKLAVLFQHKCPSNRYLFKSDGYCMIFTFWYLELRLTNKRLDRKEVFEKALKIFEEKGSRKICKTVIGYAQFIQKISNKYYLIKGIKGRIIMVVNKIKIIIPSVLISFIGLSGSVFFILKKLNFI